MKRLKKEGIILLISLIVVVIVGLVALAIIDAHASREFERRIAELKARGKPVTLRELEPPDVPDEENAAPLLSTAFATLGDKCSDEEDEVEQWWRAGARKHIKYFTEEIKTAMTAAVDKYSEAIRLVEEAVRRPKCKFRLEWEMGFEMLLNHLPKFRRMANLLRMKAILESDRGLTEDAIATCVVGIRMADALEDEPMLVSQLVRYGALGISFDALGKVLRDGEVAPEAYREVMNALREFEIMQAFLKALDGERCFGLDVFDSLLSGGSQAIEHIAGMQEWSGWQTFPYIRNFIVYSWFGKPFVKLDVVAYLDLLERHFGDITEDAAGETTTLDIERDIQKLPFYCVGTRSLAPRLIPAEEWARKAIAQRDIAILACALELHRMDTGKYPDSLDGLARDIIEEIPRDPFSGESYRYEVREEGFIIYSIGPDRKDDGGKPLYRDIGDIVWEK